MAVDPADRLVGFLGAGLSRPHLHLWEIAVRRQLQRRGIGRALLLEAIGIARRLSLKSVTLTTLRNVKWSVPFYRQLGFHVMTSRELDARLVALLNNEADAGPPAIRRYAMRLLIA